MQYRYEFEKGSKKHHCPQCEKKTFVRYVDNETGEFLPVEFGRCDREKNCGYWGTPKGEYANTYEVKFTPPPPTSYHPIRLVKRSGRNFKQNNTAIRKFFNLDKKLLGGPIKWFENQELQENKSGPLGNFILVCPLILFAPSPTVLQA